MTFEEIVARLQNAGFQYLSTSECNQLANDAYLIDICEQEIWPFLEASAKGAAPLSISDLRHIEYVIDTTNTEKLKPLLRARITDDWNPDLTETGTPRLYYVTEAKTVNVFPVAADQLEVRYWKVPEELSGSKEPLLPKRFHSLIVDGAKARGYELSDDFELAQTSAAAFQARLQVMRESLDSQQRDEPDDYLVIEDIYALR